MRVDITIDQEQKLSQATLQAFEAELHRKVIAVFPATKINVRKGTVSGVEVAGFALESDREILSNILQDVWQQDGWA